jgi:predicted HTH transcriptional regulator
MDLIQSGENSFLEYKSTMRWNWKENKLDRKMEEVILKTISAFSNGDGGKLIIGVTDEGDIIGLESDYNTLREPNKDHFELHLRNLVNDAFGKAYGATQLDVKFPVVNDIEICEVDIKSGKNPLFVTTLDKNGVVQRKFYLRSGNSSQELNIEETASYVSKRFNNN